MKRASAIYPKRLRSISKCARSNISSSSANSRDCAAPDFQTRVHHVSDRCAVSDVKDKVLGKLSKGYRQRVGLAQAIIHNPDVLILDEPTAGLDPKQINETRDLIKSLAGDHTIILSTHILPEVSQTCEQVVIINKGRLVATDSVNNLQTARGPVIRARRSRGANRRLITRQSNATRTNPRSQPVISKADGQNRAIFEVEAARSVDPRRPRPRHGRIRMGPQRTAHRRHKPRRSFPATQ